MLHPLHHGLFAFDQLLAGTAAAGSSIDSHLLYFSLITLTTIGYGDIVPVSAPARVLCGIEGLIGQLFVAIIIARLVGMEIAERLGRSA